MHGGLIWIVINAKAEALAIAEGPIVSVYFCLNITWGQSGLTRTESLTLCDNTGWSIILLPTGKLLSIKNHS